jgi:hypothetical protein
MFAAIRKGRWSADWQKSWFPFLRPAHAVAMFTAEVLEAFVETFPQARQLLVAHEPTHVTNWRKSLRDPVS